MAEPTAPEGDEPMLTRDHSLEPLLEFQPKTLDPDKRTVDVVWTTGARVKRMDFWTGEPFEEELVVSRDAIDLSRLNAGAPLLPVHQAYDLDVPGVVERAWIEGNKGIATVRFDTDEAGEKAFGKVRRGMITSVSVGYNIDRTQVEIDRSGPIPVRRYKRWTPLEISLVPVPADAGAQIRSANRNSNPVGDAQKERKMTEQVVDPVAPVAPVVNTEQRAAPAPEPRLTLAAPPSPVANPTEFRTAAKGLGLTGDDALDAMSRGITVDAWRTEVINQRAADADRTAPNANIAPNGGGARVGVEERQLRMAGIEDALVSQLTRAKPTENGQRFMECRNLVELAAEAIGERRVPSGFGRREDFLRRVFHTTSDFPLLLENSLNKALQARYAMAMPTYRKIARQRSYQDFRDHSTIRMGDFPTLQAVDPNGGEVKGGTFGESREKTAVSAYGVRVNLSRQLLVNDTLDGITQVLNDRGNAVARFEETTFYAMMISGSSSNGPTLLETARQVFNSTDVTLAGTPSTIDVANLSIARAAMRKKTSQDGAKLDLIGRVLLVGPDKETVAQQVVAPIIPALPTSPNPFSGSLEVVVTAHITGNAWYVFADPSVAPCFEWGLLDGYEAPRFRMEEVFGVQGTALTLEHDFGCGAIDFRGGFRNAGA